jgi:tagaturonate epimerase-like protein
MRPINRFLLEHELRISTNPCISPDFCLDWPALQRKIAEEKAGLRAFSTSEFETAHGTWTLIQDEATGDCAWRLGSAGSDVLSDGVRSGDATFFPATWDNLLRLKNAIQEHDHASTIFPTAGANLGRSTLGIGARFTTLHWPGVEWAMSALDLGMTANQNSIPRELVYDVDAMLAGHLDTVPFPFIGTNVPEGHQGQSVEGMSHGCVLSKLETGFHRRRIAWSFNADHQPIGGKFDAREEALVRGCLLASYITFDLSPELAQTQVPADPAAWVASRIPRSVVDRVREELTRAAVRVDDTESARLLAYVWPAMEKMKRRDDKYRAARERAFTTETGRRYLRELSIDELPGLTSPETTAVMLALCAALDMRIDFVAPAFGFQKNTPYPDDNALRGLIDRQWAICSRFDASIGFHSGSGKSAGNYRVMGDVTGGRLEIKTSGRYTYEMGVALAASSDARDAQLWRDWYRFTLEMALAGAFSADDIERTMARSFITASMPDRADVFASPAACRTALEALPPSPEHMFFFEYNFLYVLAAAGRPEKAALGDHSPAGYAQRARFYGISAEARLRFLKNIAAYIVFLAEHTGLAPAARAAAARARLERYTSLDQMLADIAG